DRLVFLRHANIAGELKLALCRIGRATRGVAAMSADARIFAPESMVWRICRERATLLHGPAAAVLQVAHPRIALGVLDHSNFKEAPTARLHRTLDAVYSMAFGTSEEAEAATDGVARIRERVRGDARSRK